MHKTHDYVYRYQGFHSGGATCLTPRTAPTIRHLADLRPQTLAITRGSSYNTDCSEAHLALADDYDRRHHDADGGAPRLEHLKSTAEPATLSDGQP